MTVFNLSELPNGDIRMLNEWVGQQFPFWDMEEVHYNYEEGGQIGVVVVFYAEEVPIMLPSTWSGLPLDRDASRSHRWVCCRSIGLGEVYSSVALKVHK
ncbi:MAG: hypothetical protein ACFB15_31420 [Cyclobacteriaceae bacterium]